MTPPDTTPGFWDTIFIYAAMVGAWLVGEGGKAVIAGAAGGFVRWLGTQRFHIGEGIVSVISGAIMAHFGTPLMLALLQQWVGELQDVSGYTVPFFSGLVGMSLAKLTIAFIEQRAAKLQPEEHNQPEDHDDA